MDTYLIYYLDSFSTLAKSLSSFWRRCREQLNREQIVSLVSDSAPRCHKGP